MKRLDRPISPKNTFVESTDPLIPLVPLESEYIDFDVRVQAVCSKSRPDTYFGTLKITGERVFVKGPYYSVSDAKRCLQIFQVKQLCMPELAPIPIRLVELIPNQFAGETNGIGVRKNIDVTKPHWFVISTNLITVDKPINYWIPRYTHNTKTWGDIDVVCWKKIDNPTIPVPSKLKGETLVDYTLNVLFRYVMGIPDAADRNFLVYTNSVSKTKVLSTDEEGFNKSPKIKTNLGVKKCKLIVDTCKDNWEKVHAIISNWQMIVVQFQENIKAILELNNIDWFIENLKSLEILESIENLFN